MMSVDQYKSSIIDAWGSRVKAATEAASNEIRLDLAPEALNVFVALCADLQGKFHARFITIIPADERATRGVFTLRYVFAVEPEDLFLLVRVVVDPSSREVPSISSVIPAADWHEREMKDWFGIMAFPNIHRLAVHPDWPEDSHPLLKDFPLDQTVHRVPEAREERRVVGEGVFEIPVGPVHAGIIEPGHFRFSVAGEPILNLDARLFYTHKGTEKMGEGLPPGRSLFLAERISGDTSVGHAIAFCHAIERAAGMTPPKRATVIRSMLIELERLYNHAGDIGAVLLDVGFSAGAVTGTRIKEELMRLNEILTGSRLLRGVVTIGGARQEIEETIVQRQALRDTLVRVRDMLNQLMSLVMSTASVLDRLETTGRLAAADVLHLGVTGIAARASGIDRDTRRDHPHCAYPFLQFSPKVRKEGDVFARVMMRVEEFQESLLLLNQLSLQHEGEPIVAAQQVGTVGQSALGYVEGWRGEIFHWVMMGEAGTVDRWKIVDPSFQNWRGVLVAVQNNIVPDFPVINKSFNLSYSGNDR